MQWAHKKQSNDAGFTIVELLIVVVVIAILAAITIVSYNGITRQANESAAKSGVSNAQKKLATWSIDHGDTFPISLSEAGIVDGGSTSYQYSANNASNPKGYCVTVSANGIYYRLGKNFTFENGTVNESNATAGACPGHSGSTTPITNLQQNPGVEVSTATFSGPNGATIARDTARFRSGNASLRVTMPAGGLANNVGLTIVGAQAVGVGIIQPNTAYTVSMYLYVPSGAANMYVSLQGGGYATRSDPAASITDVKDQWVRVYNTFTTNASGNVSIYALNRTAIGGSTSFWVDDIMITQGESVPPPVYADGNSAGWSWNGTAGLSSSKGPAL